MGHDRVRGQCRAARVRTQEDAQAFQTTTFVNADGFPTRSSSPTAISQSNDYWTLLPSSNLTLHPSNAINIRLAAARTMSRPEFEQMAPINVVSVPDPALATTNANSRGSGTIGNTQLKPQTAWNLDLTGEYYTRNGAAYVVSAFYKRVSNFIGYSTVFNTQLAGLGSQLFNVTSAVNFSTGRVYGFEVGANQPLDMLLPIKGFGIQGNFTFVDSKINSPLNGRAFAFPGSSKYNVNGTIYYSHKALDLRAAYVYRSNFLSALPSLGIIDFPTYTNGYGTLDASATIKVAQNVEVILTGSNLTRTARRDYLYNPATFLNYYTQPRQLVGAVRLTF
jgi:TonB-dependent receptor